MLNLKKVILGLGLLGMVSSANASYINIEAGYYNLESNSFSYNRPEQKSASKVSYLTENGGSINSNESWESYTATYTAVSGGVQKFYNGQYENWKNGTSFIPDGTVLFTGCPTNTTSCTTKVKITVMAGDINGAPAPATYDDTALRNQINAVASENTILKAKVQALENKVYSCVQ